MSDAGKYAVVAHAGSHPENLTGYRFRSRDRAVKARAILVEEYPHAVIAYTPTRAQEQRWRAQRARVEAFGLTWFQVVIKTARVFNEPLGPMYLDRPQAERALSAWQQVHPHATVWAYESFFHPDRAADRREREELLAAMAPRDH